jgi:hypothetical protein
MDIAQLVWCHTLHTIGPLLSAANHMTCCRVPLQALLCKQRVAVVDACLSSLRIGNGGRKLLVTQIIAENGGPTVRAVDWFCDKPPGFSQFICFSPSPRRSCDDLIQCDPSNVPTCVARSLLCREPPMRHMVLSDYLPSLRSHWLFSAHGVSLHTGRDVSLIFAVLLP